MEVLDVVVAHPHIDHGPDGGVEHAPDGCYDTSANPRLPLQRHPQQQQQQQLLMMMRKQ